jgi:glutamine amidotransferase
MCRLFAALTLDPLPTEDVLLDARRSLLKQSTIDRKRLQSDGWGVGWFAKGRPVVRKSPKPIYREATKLRQAARAAKSETVLSHIRWASNPMKLPRHELIGSHHTQPFTHQEWLFVHNGTLLIPREVKSQLGSWERFVKGKNDSEVLFYWLLKDLHRAKTPQAIQQALHYSLKGLDLIWSSCKQHYPLYRGPFHGLNWVLTNGSRLIAFCCADRRGFGAAVSLADKEQPYYQLRWQSNDRAVWIASEPIDSAGLWRSFRNGELLIAERKKSGITIHQTQIL